MGILTKPTVAYQGVSSRARQVGIGYAAVLVMLAVAHLYSFEDFNAFMTSEAVGLVPLIAVLFAPLLVLCEVFALPFLLRVAVSPAFRLLSMGCAVLAPALLVFMTSWLVFGYRPVENVGLLGAVIDLVPGVWAVCISGALLIAAVWSAWGLAPRKSLKAE